MRKAAIVAAATVALLLGAGCGGGGEDDEATRACKAESENAAGAAVVAAAFEKGQLGTQAKIESAFEGPSEFFDESGHMLPYGELKGITRARFDEWVTGSAVRGSVRDEMFAARDQVREDGWPDC